MRLFMVPRMFHCGGGSGTGRCDAMTPLIDWVETGSAPEKTKPTRVDTGKVVRTRPLCPYPQVARYTGAGSPDEAAGKLSDDGARSKLGALASTEHDIGAGYVGSRRPNRN
jgi:hypothetical protein